MASQEPIPDSMPADVSSIADMCRMLVATSALLLALTWGLTGAGSIENVVFWVRAASLSFLAAIVLSIVAYQFIISKLRSRARDIGGRGSVAVCFFLAWIAFLLALLFLVIAIFQVSPSSVC